MIKFRQVILLQFFLLSFNVFSDSSIYKTCPNTRKINEVSTIQELISSICYTQEKYERFDSITSLTQSILTTLQQLSNAPGEWQNDPSLKVKLSHLSKGLESIQKLEIEKIKSKSPLQRAMQNLNEKWHNSEDRKNPKNANEYYKDIKKVLSLTKIGKKVNDCFKKAEGSNISGENFTEMPNENKELGAKMEFLLVDDPKNPSKYIKTIHFNSDLDPLDAIALLAHEMQHGCNSKKIANLKDEYIKGNKSVAEKMELASDFDQENAIDEMRAYKVTTETFKELSEAAPELMCNVASESILFGTQHLNAAEYNAKIDDMFNTGIFPQYLISFYVGQKEFQPSSVLVLDKDDMPTNQLRPDLIEKLRKEGFFVQ